MFRHGRVLALSYNALKLFVRHKCFPMNFSNYLSNLPNMQFCKLANDFNIATEERDCCNVCIGFFFDTGSRYEDVHENGISHFFEHIAFKGTKTKSKTVLEDKMSSIGGKFSCYTTREMVGFYAECLREDISCVYDILTDCLFNNAYSQPEIELQKNTVYLEMLQHDKNVHNLVDDYLHSAAFQGTPLAQTIMGPTSNLYKFTPDRIFAYREKTLDPSRIVLASVGGVKHEQMVELSNSLAVLQPAKCIPPFPRRYTGSQITFRDDSIPVTHMAMAVEGPSYCSKDNIIMSIAAAIIGGWDKSQPSGLDLSHRVSRSASTSRLCESYKAFNIAYKDTGLWGIQFISPRLVVHDMITVVQDEWMILCTTITEGEVDRAKNELKTKVLTNNESAAKTCRAIGRWILYKQCKTSLYQRLCAIDDITVQDVKETCFKYIYDKCPVIIGLGATECIPDYSRLRGSMYWLRY